MMRTAFGAACAAFALACPAPALATTTAPGAEVALYGTMSDGREVQQVTLRNRAGMVVRVITLGAIITHVEVPDDQGRMENVALGLPDLPAYETRNPDYYFGGVVGRYAGRIADARFQIDGQEVRLTANDGPNALHGGAQPGFIGKVWTLRHAGPQQAVLTYTSPAGEQNFPGKLDVEITYSLTDEGALFIDYAATTDAPTVLNLTNHSYFNLAGADGGRVYDHSLRVFADRVVATDNRGIPTGTLQPVAGTVFDFRTERPVAREPDELPANDGVRGFNHSWLVDPQGQDLAAAARVSDPESGRVLDVFTTEPSIHIYLANYFPGTQVGAAGVTLAPHTGIALETQHLPDSPNRAEFPSTLLRPGETFRSRTAYHFHLGR